MVGQVVVWSGGQWVCTVEYGWAGGSVMYHQVGSGYVQLNMVGQMGVGMYS